MTSATPVTALSRSTTSGFGAGGPYFGPDRWIEDIEDWRLIGLDALLIGSGEREEGIQADWLDEVMNDAGSRQIAWFLHRPLFLDNPSEADTGYWSIKPQPRAQLLDLIKRHSVALVASGHLHKAHDFQHDGTRYIWAPSTAFLVGPAMKAPPMPGEDRLGAVVYDLEAGVIAARNHTGPRSFSALARRGRRRDLPARPQQMSGGEPRKTSREPANCGKAQR